MGSNPTPSANIVPVAPELTLKSAGCITVGDLTESDKRSLKLHDLPFELIFVIVLSKGHNFAVSRRDAPEACIGFTLQTRGRRECRGRAEVDPGIRTKS